MISLNTENHRTRDPSKLKASSIIYIPTSKRYTVYKIDIHAVEGNLDIPLDFLNWNLIAIHENDNGLVDITDETKMF